MSSTDSSPSRKFTIAITGSSGRVGTGVVLEALRQGHTVVAIDHLAQGSVPPQERYTYLQVDLMDYPAFLAAVKNGGCDAIIHLAAVFNLLDKDGNKMGNVNQHNTGMNYNALNIAWELGIDHIVLASSVNSIGMSGSSLCAKDESTRSRAVGSERPRFDYLPLDEHHPFYPQDAYAVGKYIVEIHADAFVRRTPSMRIASLRFHAVTADDRCTPEALNAHGGYWKDLWGWVSNRATARACLAGLTAPEDAFPRGTHETFFIAAGTTMKQDDSGVWLEKTFPEIKDVRVDYKGSNRGFFDTSKAQLMLGWKEEGFPWSAGK